ncbi:hypothetical protein [Streptomyces sp. NPDC001070]
MSFSRDHQEDEAGAPKGNGGGGRPERGPRPDRCGGTPPRQPRGGERSGPGGVMADAPHRAGLDKGFGGGNGRR